MKNNYFKNVIFFMIMAIMFTSYGQNQKEKEKITGRYDKNAITQLERRFSAKAQAEKQKAIQAAQLNNWPIVVEENGKFAELQRLAPDGSPIYYMTFNDDAAKSTRTDHLNIGGSLGLNLDGQNMTAHIWDAGIARATHQEYDGPGGNDRYSVGDGSTSLHYHAAHVTGTIMASGFQPAAKGMAPQAQAIGFDWNSDLSEATAAANNGMLISNHSYGFRSDLVPDYYFGGYISDSRDWDNLMFNAPYYLMVVAAGNDGNSNYNGTPLDGNAAYDKLTGHSTSKNNMVVANAQDANIDASGNLVSVSINGSSSEGPTDDYRIKPDITGNGTGLYSTYQNSDNAYNSITGTSMASPNVAGTLLLLQQHANNLNGNYMRAATLKGLALHTADDIGPTGPDPVHGWGLLNAKRAAETLSTDGNESEISELTLASGQTYQITVESDGINDLMASISWTDRPGTASSALNSNTPKLINDLDIRITQGSTTYLPWKLTGVTTNGKGDNIVDPFERVEVDNASGNYTITVSNKGSLVGGSQNYSLIITGLSNTPVVCNAVTPTNITVAAFADTTATIFWDAVPSASYDFRYRELGGSWNTMTIGGNSVNLTGLTPETTYEIQVKSICPDNSESSFSNIVNFTTTELQLNYCDSESTNTNDEYISRVELNTIDNVSGAQFYSNFTNISTDLAQGQSYTITVTPTWTGTVYPEGYAVWIDYNRDGDFDDAGEQVWTQAVTTATPVSGSFTIPNGTFIGNTRMRVTMQYNAIPAPCGTFTWGEVEDYTVNLVGSNADTEAPIITLNGASTIDVEQGNTYIDQGATASDNIDGDITADIIVGGDIVDTNVVGTYILTYNVSDNAGNAAVEVARTVNVTPETTPPVITLIGDASVNIMQGNTYVDQGATALDNFDGDITTDIVVGGDIVDTSVIGSYIITYNVSDNAGNAAVEVARTVNVTPETTPPVITLIGDPVINVIQGDTYVDQGATASDNIDGDISANIIVGGDIVDTSVIGSYIITYNVSDNAGNAAAEVTRTVNVTSETTPPVITLIGDPMIDVIQGDTYVDQGATASDNIDGDISANIIVGGDIVDTNVVGTYTITYNVSDNAGNTAVEVTRTVNVTSETTPPVITLIGDPMIDVIQGDTYVEQGATASDNIDGDITADIIVGGDIVDTNVIGSYIITYNVSDNAGNAAVEVTRTVNVTPETTPPVITLIGNAVINLVVGDIYNELGATATDNFDGDITSDIVIGGDTVDTSLAGTYLVTYNVSDNAGNAASQVIRTINVTDSSSNCGLTVFAPYTEGFENTFGDWSQSTDDDIDWSLRTNGTPSGGTGPGSASEGDYYIYVEASGNGNGYPNKRAILNSPCFDLNGLTHPTVKFEYHMNGANDMGNIDLEVSSDNGNTWTSIWNKSAKQGNKWKEARVDLSAYANMTVKLRFNRITGSTWKADIAIDNFKFLNESPYLACDNTISAPYTESFENGLGVWTQSTLDDIDWTILDNGTPSGGTGPGSASEGSYYAYVEASGNDEGYPNKRAVLNSPCFDISGLTHPVFKFNYHMKGAADMGTIDLEASTDNGMTWTSIWSESGNKGNQWNNVSVDLNAYIDMSIHLRFNRVTGPTWKSDVAIDNIEFLNESPFLECTTPISAPHYEEFENGLGNWSQSTLDDIDWTINSNGTPSGGTGPNSAIRGINYIYVEASGNGTGFPNKSAILNSPCLDLSGFTSPMLTFNYHMKGAPDMGTLDVEASTDNGMTWTSIWNESGNKGNQWNYASIDLKAYVNTIIHLRFNRVTGASWKADVAIDNVQLSDLPDNPAGCDSLNLSDAYFSFHNQDKGSYQLSNGNSELEVFNNAWKFIYLNYTVTPNTVIQFDFKSTIEGEIHGIGLESDNQTSSNLVFKLHGTQNWGINNFDNYPNNGQWVNYSINVGNFYTGVSDRLLFVSDHDGGAKNGNSFFRNIVIFEDANANGICDDSDLNVLSVSSDNLSPIDGELSSEGLEFVLYPNPVTHNTLNVRLKGDNESPMFKIFNLLGQVVKQGELNTEQIDVKELQSGVYLIEIKTNSETTIKRFIIE